MACNTAYSADPTGAAETPGIVKKFEMALDVNHSECPEAAQIIVKELPAFPKHEQSKEQQANPTKIHVHGAVRLWDIRLKPWD